MVAISVIDWFWFRERFKRWSVIFALAFGRPYCSCPLVVPWSIHCHHHCVSATGKGNLRSFITGLDSPCRHITLANRTRHHQERSEGSCGFSWICIWYQELQSLSGSQLSSAASRQKQQLRNNSGTLSHTSYNCIAIIVLLQFLILMLSNLVHVTL